MVLIGIVGKPSSGKSSFFKAATMIDVKIAPYPFTTIEPNRGMSQVTVPCVGKDLGVRCQPRSYRCDGSSHFIPIELLDVAGLVPGSHAGRGKGNQFLNDLIKGQALIHVVDASGTTDAEGNMTSDHDPLSDVKFLEEEIEIWFADVIKRNLSKIADKKRAAEVLGGLGVRREHAAAALGKAGLLPERLAKELRKLSKPILIAANKADLPQSDANIERMKKAAGDVIVPCSAAAEIALREASNRGIIEYFPGAGDFKIANETMLTAQQRAGLEMIRTRVLKKYGSSGIAASINSAVFDLLGLMPVYPVENESKLTDKTGAALPDVFLMPRGSTALDLAFEVHTEIGKNFVRAIDARTKKVLGKDYRLKPGDVIKIVARS